MNSQAIGILILAVLTETLVEYFARPLLKPKHDEDAEPVPILDEYPLLRYAAALCAVALCLAYRVDLLALFGLLAFSPFVGYVITGLVVARGSNWLHDFVTKWLGS
jgi:hypothetical protein